MIVAQITKLELDAVETYLLRELLEHWLNATELLPQHARLMMELLAKLPR